MLLRSLIRQPLDVHKQGALYSQPRKARREPLPPDPFFGSCGVYLGPRWAVHQSHRADLAAENNTLRGLPAKVRQATAMSHYFQFDFSNLLFFNPQKP
jgi:hypothetical protein